MPGRTRSATATAPFKSATKWSGASYGGHGNWVIGAPDVLLDPGSAVAAEAERIGAQGLRVLLLGSSDLPVDAPGAPGVVTPAALVVLEQRIRPDARDTLDFFATQKVSIKVISGDNAVSVGAVAGSLGLHGECMDARHLPEETAALADELESHTTFGRVRPDQKRAMVHALQSRGHTVAMTGDGVNDVLALKDADIGVAMGSGSSASRAVAQIVLLDNRFATLPYVVAEGRRVIGNIERVSNLFLTKTVYSVLLAILVAWYLGTVLLNSAWTRDQAERAAIYGEMYEILADELPWLWLSTSTVMSAAQGNLENWDPQAGFARWNIDAWTSQSR